MSRQNVNTEYKFGDTDGFMLTDIDTDETLMLIPCDTAGNFSWQGCTRAPLERNAMQTSNTSNQYSDLERPWISIPQEDWTGGRGNDIFTKDTSRYGDGKRCQAAFNSCLYNGPLDYYSDGDIERAVSTNCPGSLKWMKVSDNMKYICVQFTCGSQTKAGELYLHIRRRGTPTAQLTVELRTARTGGTVLASKNYKTTDITDTLAEFRKFAFSNITLTQGTTYYIVVHCNSSTADDYWEVGIKPENHGKTKISTNGTTYKDAPFELYYRVAQAQSGYKYKFFTYEQMQFAVKNKGETVAPELLINGAVGSPTNTSNNTITDSNASWETNEWAGARIGIVYRAGSEEHADTWRTILSNTSTTITVDRNWDITPATNCLYIINDTPLWKRITGHGLSGYVTDIHVIHGIVYFCQGDYIDMVKMRLSNGVFYFQTLEGHPATFVQSVRDSSAMMLYRARNDGISGRRTVERSVLLDWKTDTSWSTITDAITTKDHQSKSVSETIVETKVVNGDTTTTNRTTTKATTIDGQTSTDTETFEDTLTSTSTTSSGTTTTTKNDSKTTETEEGDDIPVRTSVNTESKNFSSPDRDSVQYVITIGNFTTENNTGSCVITLQESEDNQAWHEVQSVVAESKGTWYIFAHCQYKYRRFQVTATGTNTTVNNISFTTSQLPHWEDPIYLLDNYGKITRLFEYGAEVYKSLWIAQEGMISSINKIELNNGGATYTLDRINLDELQTTSDMWNGKAMTTSDVYLVWSWLYGLQRYYNTQLEGKGPDHDEGMPFNRQGRVTQIVSYPSNIFIAIDGEDGYSCVMQHNGSGWHEIYRAPNPGERIHDMAFQPIYGKRPDRLWLNVGDDLVWLTMPSRVIYALLDSNAEFTHESVMVSSWHTAGMVDIEKLWQSLKIIADHLDGTTCWVEADYQLDNETVWHPIKNWYIESPSQKEELNEYGSVNGKKFRYRLRLQTTDMYKTPKINAVVLEAVGRVDIKMSYNFYFRNIKYKRDINGEFEDLEPLDMQTVLDEWANRLKKLRLNSRWKIFDNKLVYLDAVQTSVLNELSEGYIGQITLNEL